ncbi:MAG: hypothetical protein RLZZ370_1714 [Bacteroidota bacterium]
MVLKVSGKRGLGEPVMVLKVPGERSESRAESTEQLAPQA